MKNRFDVFLCHNSEDKLAVKKIGSQLKEKGLHPWLDEWELRPGMHWQPLLEEQIDKIDAAAVFLGPSGIGPWQQMELEAYLREFVKRRCPVIPVIMSGVSKLPELPLFLRGMTWVDFRQDESDPLEKLIWGITGERRGSQATKPTNPDNAQVRILRDDQEPPEVVGSRVTPPIKPNMAQPNPYRGLETFREQDAELFFGREASSKELYQAVTKHRFVAVVGASGSGKSSLVFAGLLPRLHQEEDWLVIDCRPRSQPFSELAAALVPLLYKDSIERFKQQEQLAEKLNQRGISLSVVVRSFIHSYSEKQLLLFVDQFEELYTQNVDRDEQWRKVLQQRFVDSLLEAVSSDTPITVLIALRADFMGHTLEYNPFTQALNRYPKHFLGPMMPAQLRAVIEKPAHKRGVTLESGLTDLLLQEVGDEPGNLPLLEFALQQLWERQSNRQLTHKAYQKIGGVNQALANHAEEVFDQFEPEEQERLRSIFIKLVRPGEGVEDTRQVANIEQVKVENWPLVARLADKRLVVTGRRETEKSEGEEKWTETVNKTETVNETETVEVAHEALIRHWQRLHQWVDEDREFLVWHQRLQQSIREWKDVEEDDDALLKGARLVQAKQWLAKRPENLSSEDKDFILKSQVLREQEVAEREAQRQRELDTAKELAQEAKTRSKLQRKAIFSLVGLLVALLLMFMAAGLQWQRAETEKNVAVKAKAEAEEQRKEAVAREVARELAARAEMVFDNMRMSSEQSGLLAVESLRQKRTLEGYLAWVQVIALLPRVVTRMDHEGPVRTVAFSPDGTRLASASSDDTARVWDPATGKELARMDHEDAVWTVAFSPDGTRLASVSGYNTWVWDLVTGKELARMNHGDGVWDVAFSPDGTRLASASEDNTARVWDIATGEEFIRMDHEGPVQVVAFSPDGTRLASASKDNTARVWDTATGKEFIRIDHESSVSAVVFSSDGTRLASVSGYNARVWNTATGEELARMSHEDNIWAMAFSPDGTRLASASWDNVVRVWDTAIGEEFIRMDHEGPVRVVAFSPDSTRLASVSGYNAWVWDSVTGEELTRMDHEGPVRAMAFSPDGTRLTSASEDNTARVWDTVTGKELARMDHEGPVWAVTFSPDDMRLASASEDNTARVWDTVTGKELARMDHEGPVWAVAFSPDGTRLVSISEYNVWIWDPVTGKKLIRMDHEGPVRAVAFSPDGTRLADVSWDDTVRVWDTATGEELARMNHGDGVRAVTFSPNGMRLASASEDNTARVWDTATGEELARMNHGDGVRAVTFSPNGMRLASASEDNTVRVWDLVTGKELARMNHGDGVWDVAFSPDGTRLASASEDNTARVWLWQTEELVTMACSRLERNLNRKEWTRYFSNEPYRPTCPDLPIPE